MFASNTEKDTDVWRICRLKTEHFDRRTWSWRQNQVIQNYFLCLYLTITKFKHGGLQKCKLPFWQLGNIFSDSVTQWEQNLSTFMLLKIITSSVYSGWMTEKTYNNIKYTCHTHTHTHHVMLSHIFILLTSSVTPDSLIFWPASTHTEPTFGHIACHRPPRSHLRKTTFNSSF